MPLTRLRDVYPDRPIFFITACTHERRWILDNDDVQTGFLDFALNAEVRGVAVGRYVLMPDHIHLFAAFTPESPSLSLWIKSLKNGLSRALRSRDVPAPHWQKGFFDHLIRSSESYSAKWEYVRENPVRAGLVTASEEWPYQGEVVPLDAWRR